MRIGTDGLVTNEFDQVLLILRNDTFTYATPGGGLEEGELPTENIAREIQEETGLIAMPVRLVSLNFWALKPHGLLSFTFRCLQRGGELQTTPEALRVGFYKARRLPRPMLTLNRDRIEHGVRHSGGPVAWWTVRYTLFMHISGFFLFKVVYPLVDLKRQLQKKPAFLPPPDWQITVQVVVQNESGHVLWHNTAVGWQLPHAPVPSLTAPWETAVAGVQAQTAVAAQLTDLRGVYVAQTGSAMTLLFTAVATTPQPNGHSAWFPAAAPPADASPQAVRFVQQALHPETLTVFEHLPS